MPPGGHIELDETLEEAGRRELREETGLDLGSEPPSGVLGLWESVYPHRLDYGQPLRQHLVVYLWMRSQLTWKQLNQQLKLDPDETDSALWLPTSLIDSVRYLHHQRASLTCFLSIPDFKIALAGEGSHLCYFSKGTLRKRS